MVAVANAAVLMVALGGAVVVEPMSDGEGSVAAAGGGGASATGTAQSSVPGSTQAAPKAGSAPPRKPSGQTAGTATTVQPPAAAVQAAADGTYKRRLDWEFESPMSRKGGGETSTRVSTTARSAAEVRQHYETTMTSMDEENDGRPTGSLGSRDLRWTEQGVYGVQGNGSDGSRSCEPAETLELQLPLATGARWATTAVCTYERREGGRATSRTETTYEVTGALEVDVLGKSRSVWEIVAHSKNTADGKSEGATTETITLFSPELGVDVRTDTTLTASILRYTSTSRLIDIDLD